MAPKKPKLMIIDGNALIHRSFHALPATMMTKSGEATNAVYGFTTVLIKAIKDLRPEYIALTLDKKAKTFRHEEYSDYKANRVSAPDELYGQIPRIKELADSFNIPIFEMDGYEADDLIGTIAKKVDADIEKVILTGDMDTLQLVNDHVQVYTMSRGITDSVLYDKKAVKDRYQLTPAQMTDFKALRGDPSDNIPGVKGIGEKIATDLLLEFKTLDNIYKFIETDSDPESKIKPRIIELLKEKKDDAYSSKKLATIYCEVPIDFELEQTKFSKLNQERIVDLLSELEFKSLLPRIKDLISNSRLQAGQVSPDIDKFERNKSSFDYLLVNTPKLFEKFFAALNRQNEFTFDTEITSFDPLTGKLRGISFSWKEKQAYYLEINEAGRPDEKLPKRQANLSLFQKTSDAIKASSNGHDWLQKLKPIFENGKIKKSGHNIKFDIRVMRAHGVETRGIDFDTMIASYVLNPGTRQHNLDALTFSELGFEKISKEDLLGKGKDKKNFSNIETEKLSLYSCEDADFTHRLFLKLHKQIKEQSLEKLFFNIEMPLIRILANMEDNGIKIDKKYLSVIGAKVEKRIEAIEKEIWKLAGIRFNISSTQQLRDVLFNKLLISAEGVNKIKTGLSTSADVLAKLKGSHPIIELIQEFRELSKLQNTYIESLPSLENRTTRRIHTSFNQAVTATGRLSSTDPNLQNIPIRTELGKEIRRAFIADKGYKLVSFDYSQIELRLAAHMSGDKKMIEAFKNNVDIHSATAAEINEVALQDVTRSMRREAKAINFGILYGQGPHGLSQTADIPYERAKKFIEHYFQSYPGIKDYVSKSIEDARENGFTETLFGRRRFLPEINSSVVTVKKGAERMAINTPLQGTAADMIKAAMIEIYKTLISPHRQDGNKSIKMLLQVHDELLFEIAENRIDESMDKIRYIMQNVIKLKVPILVDVSVGDNWGEMKATN